MAEGRLAGIFVAEKAGAPVRSLNEVRAFAGTGLEGDRYAVGGGTFANYRGKKKDRHVTLIEREALEALARDYGVALSPDKARRNLLTEGVALNHLVGRRFRVGEALLEGFELCEPCRHLEKISKVKCRRGLVHRGGLRARVLEGGLLRVGDPIVVG